CAAGTSRGGGPAIPRYLYHGSDGVARHPQALVPMDITNRNEGLRSSEMQGPKRYGPLPDLDPDEATTTQVSICRVCANVCSLKVTTRRGRIVAMRGDQENPLYHGYSCLKGRTHARLYDDPARLRHALKRTPDGVFARVATREALWEIGDRLRTILDRHGPRSI